jgi:hypothetical protein
MTVLDWTVPFRDFQCPVLCFFRRNVLDEKLSGHSERERALEMDPQNLAVLTVGQLDPSLG